MTDWNAQKAAAEQATAAKWGMWRKFIAKNPLTGSWISMAVGGGIVGAAWKLIG